MTAAPLAQRIRQLSERGRASNIDHAIKIAGEVFSVLQDAHERDIVSAWQCTPGFIKLSIQWADESPLDIDQAFVWHGDETHLDADAPFLPNEARAMAVWHGALRACHFTDIDERPLKENDAGQSTLSPLDRVINAVNRDVELPSGLTHIWSNNLLGDALHGAFVLQLEDDHLGIFVGRTMGGVDRVALLGLQPFSSQWRQHLDNQAIAETGGMDSHLIEEDQVWVSSRAERASLDWWDLLPTHVRTLMNGTLLQYSAGIEPDILTPRAEPSLQGIRLLPRQDL